VLFTAVSLEPAVKQRASLLAPLAVLPEHQGRGIGSRLVEEGLVQLRAVGVSIVFTLGHPDYYPRFGFLPAGIRGFTAPYPIEEKNADAWMVLRLDDALPQAYAGRVRCAQALDRPEYWRE
jgi:predicted N-acetyltransferase YhbS